MACKSSDFRFLILLAFDRDILHRPICDEEIRMTFFSTWGPTRHLVQMVYHPSSSKKIRT